ncbi:cytochrome b/b6 domain-containing protein [Streptomyces sp. ICBB 8177]|uniref:cytochrome b/b6 domain-containing protein n=1 Tax=Streptomyces sp. ICBB 8177 TaxID=563922 RepID=UPI000D67AFDC|nr:cytochrome b/b6 domain-containing protein [Streptomyces sp. ICBB 8177]PWI41817.1 formate dehydrogenase [Streptomyces sp. ICBB 8177]
MPLPRDPRRTPEERSASGELRRFTPAERWIHRVTAALMGTAIVTAAFLYLPALAELVGRRRLLVTVHEWSGALLPVPLLAGLVSRAYRADLGRLNRFGVHDRRWIGRVLRRVPGPRPAGKFNAGQKLYAAFVAGAVLVMLGTGIVMWFPSLTPLVWRTGSTFVHDWLALVIGVLVAGHIWMAVRDPEARRGLRTGWVSRAWARGEHPLWEREQRAPDTRQAPGDDPR